MLSRPGGRGVTPSIDQDATIIGPLCRLYAKAATAEPLEEVAVTEWAPATEAEAAMRDALRVDDQELYFRILARVELLLPISSEAIAGRAPMGWGTWTAGGRTHVLAFTSSEAMRACLAEHAGSARRIPYYELAAAWPNLEWWLAVNPGLPIEGYLPAWFEIGRAHV